MRGTNVRSRDARASTDSIIVSTTQPSVSIEVDRYERIADCVQFLRLASMNLIIAEEEALAVSLDDFIDQIEVISLRKSS